MIVQAGNSQTPENMEALEELCSTYWYPLYAYVRRCGESPEQSKDLTQGFFCELLEKNLVGTADSTRGKFRWFLLASFKHFLAHQWQKGRAQKRGGHLSKIELDALQAEERYLHEPTDDLSPDVIYEQRWAHILLERAHQALQQQYTGAPKEKRFSVLKQFLPGQEPDLSYLEAAQQLEISESLVKVEIHRLRKNYGLALRDEVAKTVEFSSQIDSELQHLIDALYRK